MIKPISGWYMITDELSEWYGYNARDYNDGTILYGDPPPDSPLLKKLNNKSRKMSKKDDK